MNSLGNTLFLHSLLNTSIVVFIKCLVGQVGDGQIQAQGTNRGKVANKEKSCGV